MFPCCDVPKTHLKVFYCNQNLNYCVQLFYQKHDEDFSLHFLDFTAFPSGLSHVCPLRNLKECELLVILEILWLRLQSASEVI